MNPEELRNRSIELAHEAAQRRGEISQQDRGAFRVRIAFAKKDQTHSTECWRWHFACGFEKVLNALEACQNNTENGIVLPELVSETSPKLQDKLDQTCDHATSMWETLGEDEPFVSVRFNYCPRCGVRL